MQNNFVMELVIVAGAWLVLCIPIWLVLWIVLPRMDRRPKDSVRCRCCWYDLRATTNDQCPECGGDLLKIGVWPVGKPNRSKLIHLSMLWFWLASITLVILINLYHHYNGRIVKFYDVEQFVLAVEQPRSGAYSQAFFTLHGNGTKWFPGDKLPSGFELTAVSIEIYAAGATVQAVTLDPATMELVPHPDEKYALECERVRAGNGTQLAYGATVSPEALAEFYPMGLDAEIDRLVISDMHNLIEFVSLASEGGQLPRSYEQNHQLAAVSRSHAPLYGSHEATYSALDDFYGTPTYLPDWISFILLGLGIIAIAIGILKIRKWCYRRDTAKWEPSAEMA